MMDQTCFWIVLTTKWHSLNQAPNSRPDKKGHCLHKGSPQWTILACGVVLGLLLPLQLELELEHLQWNGLSSVAHMTKSDKRTCIWPGFDFPGGCTLLVLYSTFWARALVVGIPTHRLSQNLCWKETKIEECKEDNKRTNASNCLILHWIQQNQQTSKNAVSLLSSDTMIETLRTTREEYSHVIFGVSLYGALLWS